MLLCLSAAVGPRAAFLAARFAPGRGTLARRQSRAGATGPLDGPPLSGPAQSRRDERARPTGAADDRRAMAGLRNSRADSAATAQVGRSQLHGLFGRGSLSIPRPRNDRIV